MSYFLNQIMMLSVGWDFFFPSWSQLDHRILRLTAMDVSGCAGVAPKVGALRAFQGESIKTRNSFMSLSRDVKKEWTKLPILDDRFHSPHGDFSVLKYIFETLDFNFTTFQKKIICFTFQHFSDDCSSFMKDKDHENMMHCQSLNWPTISRHGAVWPTIIIILLTG